MRDMSVQFWNTLAEKTGYDTENIKADYQKYLQKQGRSENTIKNYLYALTDYEQWYRAAYGNESNCAFLRVNLLDYISYKRTVQKLQAESINAKLSALTAFNEFLIDCGLTKELIITKKDRIKVQTEYASPSTIDKQQVEAFRQKILIAHGHRDHAAVTLMAYAGLRISEVVNLKIEDVSIPAREMIIRNGKGDKQRIVYINDKIVHALQEYLRIRPQGESEYLFVSRQGGKLNRTRFNQIFNQYSDIITPHTIRHFYCSNALDSGYSIAEVANQAGHSNVQTTLRYTNPTREKMKEKANLL